jgi:hypothetical protein
MRDAVDSMSKGLSRRQLLILGLAAAVSRLRHGTPVAYKQDELRLPEELRGLIQLRFAQSVIDVPADLSIRLATHIVGEVEIRMIERRPIIHTLQEPAGIALESTTEALRIRSSIFRGLHSLRLRGLLAKVIRTRHNKAAKPDPYPLAAGYVLTPPGLEVALEHELSVPDLERRLWLLSDRTGDDLEHHAKWQLKTESLAAPSVRTLTQSAHRRSS